MPTFTYKARDTSGKAVKGTMDADTKTELVDKLQKMGYMASGIGEVRAGFNIDEWFEKLKPISAEDMIMFYVQLSNMIGAGIPVLNALRTLGEQLVNKKLRDAVGSIARSVEGGDSLSVAFARHTRIFSKLFINMVKAGEASGKLDTVSGRFAEYFEKQEDLKQKIKGALFYPMILLIAGVAVTLFIVTAVIPQFAVIFTKSGIGLPLITRVFYSIGIGIKKYWYVGGIFLVLGWLGIKYFLKTEKGRLNFDRFRLKMPVIGLLQRRAALSGFARTLSTLSASGVPILESLDITKDVMGNEVLRRVVENARKAVEKGEKMSEPLRISGEFPLDAVQMISVGEETGDLDGMLAKVADFYDLSVGYSIKKLTTVMEPLFLLIMGSLVGFIMASMLLPMFDMVKLLKR